MIYASKLEDFLQFRLDLVGWLCMGIEGKLFSEVLGYRINTVCDFQYRWKLVSGLFLLLFSLLFLLQISYLAEDLYWSLRSYFKLSWERKFLFIFLEYILRNWLILDMWIWTLKSATDLNLTRGFIQALTGLICSDNLFIPYSSTFMDHDKTLKIYWDRQIYTPFLQLNYQRLR